MGLKKLSKTSDKTGAQSTVIDQSPKTNRAEERQRQNDQRFVKGSSVKIGARLTQLPLGEINQDPNNARTEFISIGLRRQLSKLFAHKWVENPTTPALSDEELNSFAQRALEKSSSTVGLAEVTETLSELWELAVHLKTNGLMQPFAVRGDNKGGYIVAFGNRRFLALCIAHGEEHSVECLSYETPPATPNLKRFVENIQRSDLPLRAKLKDFLAARAEISNSAHNESQIAISLGLPRTTYYALKTIASSDLVVALIEKGTINHITFAEQLAKFVGKNPGDSGKVSKFIESWEGSLPSWSEFLPALRKVLESAPKKTARGRPAKISVPSIGSPITLKRILSPDILDRPEWKAIEWDDDGKDNIAKVQKLFRILIEEVSK